jgi:4-hydroxybenzoate polyprenyltransferase
MEKSGLTKLQLYLQLFRLQTGAATALAPVLGAIATGFFSSGQLVSLFIVGLLYHIFGFVLNEYIDVSIDEKAPDLQKKPLVSGKISRNYALLISIASVIAAGLILFIVFQNILAILFFLLAVVLGGIYDVWGKKVYGLDFVLGIGFFFLGLSGARTSTDQVSLVVMFVSFVYLIQIVFNNAIEGGLKDVKNDRMVGARTFAQGLGVVVQDETLMVTKRFIGFGVLLRAIFFIILALIYVENVYSSDILIITIGLVLGGLSVWSLAKFIGMKQFDRGRLKRAFSIHEIISYLLLVLVLSSFVSVMLLVVLILLPILWYVVFNIVLYGQVLEPQV